MPEDIPQEKTKEQLAEERLQRYKDKPGNFFEITDVVFAALKNPVSALGISIVIGSCKRTEMDIAQSELGSMLHQTRLMMNDAAREEANKIVRPGDNGKHRIMDFMRRKK